MGPGSRGGMLLPNTQTHAGAPGRTGPERNGLLSLKTVSSAEGDDMVLST